LFLSRVATENSVQASTPTSACTIDFDRIGRVMMENRIAQSVPLAGASVTRDVVFLSKATPGDDEFALWLAPSGVERMTTGP